MENTISLEQNDLFLCHLKPGIHKGKAQWQGRYGDLRVVVTYLPQEEIPKDGAEYIVFVNRIIPGIVFASVPHITDRKRLAAEFGCYDAKVVMCNRRDDGVWMAHAEYANGKTVSVPVATDSIPVPGVKCKVRVRVVRGLWERLTSGRMTWVQHLATFDRLEEDPHGLTVSTGSFVADFVGTIHGIEARHEGWLVGRHFEGLGRWKVRPFRFDLSDFNAPRMQVGAIEMDLAPTYQHLEARARPGVKFTLDIHHRYPHNYKGELLGIRWAKDQFPGLHIHLVFGSSEYPKFVQIRDARLVDGAIVGRYEDDGPVTKMHAAPLILKLMETN